MSITVGPGNDVPDAADGTLDVDEDNAAGAAIDLGPLVTDQETDDADLAYSIVTGPAHGQLSGGGQNWTYVPAANYNGADNFTYRVTDRGDPDNCGTPGPGCAAPETSRTATVAIAVAAVNDAPVANPAALNVGEDTALPVDLAALVADLETGDADLTYEILTAPAHGQLNGTGPSRTYTPDANYNGPDSFTYRVRDRGDPDNCSGGGCDGPLFSGTDTVSITVGPVNDVPDATDTSLDVGEDTAAPVDLGPLVTDVETADANLAYNIVTGPAHGQLSGGGQNWTYTPTASYNGPDSFTYRVTDRGDPDNCGTPGPDCAAPETSRTATVSIAVGAANDAPVNVLPAGPITAVHDTDMPLTGIAVTDVDAGTEPVQVVLSVLHGTITVSTSVLTGVGPMQVTGNGTASVTVTAPLAQINTTFADANGIIYHGDSTYTGADTLTVATDDLGHSGAGGNLTDSDTLALEVVPPNAPPVATPSSLSVPEDGSATLILTGTDADGDALTFAIAVAPAHGTVSAFGPVTCSGATPNACTSTITYTPDADYNGSDSFSFTVNDGSVASAPADVAITVTAVEDAPSIQNIETAALAYTENDPATQITATATVTDADSPNFDTGTLTVDFSAGGTADDRLEIANQGNGAGQIGISGSTVSYAGNAIGTFAGGTGLVPLVVTFNANATAPIAEALVRAITYRNVSDAPTPDRTVRFVLTDGDGSTSNAATRAITVTAVNDPPALAGIEPGALAYTENDPATAITSTLTVTDPDSNITGATVSITPVIGPPPEDVLGFVNQLAITGTYNETTGVLTLTGSASPADYQTALRAVTYRNTSENPSTVPRTITFALQGGSGTASRAVTVTAVNDAPVADDETLTGANGAIGNTTLVSNDPSDGAPDPSHPKKTVTGDLLAGDTDVDTPANLLTVTPGTFATNDGGSVTIEADGDFTYTPAASTSCTDTSDFFDYTVEDSGSPEQTDTGRVTIQIAGCVWYVSNNAPAGGGGTSAAPFDTLVEAETASAANHTVFVFDGNNTATGYGGDGYAMAAGERLIGEHEGLQVDPDGGGSLGTENLHPPNAGAHPTLTATNADVIDLDDGNEIRGLNIDPQGTGGGIAGGTGDTGGATIDDVNITDTGTTGTQAGLELNGTTGTFNISNFTINNNATGVLLNNAGTANFTPTGTITITSAGAPGLSATNTNMGTSTFDAITVTGSTTGGVSITNPTNPTPGTTTFGDLSLTTTGGTGFLLNNAGNVSVPAAGTANVNATGGPAVDVTGTAARRSRSTTSTRPTAPVTASTSTAWVPARSPPIPAAPSPARPASPSTSTAAAASWTSTARSTNGQGTTAEITGRRQRHREPRRPDHRHR